MRILLMTAAVALIAMPAHAKRDSKMTCAEIGAEIEELATIETAAGNAEIGNTVTGVGAAAATQGAIMAGAGSSLPFIGGIANIATSVSKGNADIQKQRAEDAEKRLIKLETMAEMKECDF